MIRHFSAQTLALYREDGLTGRKATRVRAHLATCEICADTSSGLAEVSVVLAEVRAPAMPDHLAERIMLALASESEARVSSAAAATSTVVGPAAAVVGATAAGAAGAAPAHIPGRPDLPDRAGRQRRSWLPRISAPVALRTIAATAAVVVIAGGGYLLAAGGSSSSESSGGGTAAGSRPEPSAAGLPKGSAGAERAPAYSPVNYHRKGVIASTVALKSNVNFTRHSFGSEVRRAVQSRGVNASITASPAVPVATPTHGITGSPRPTVRQTLFAPLVSVPHLGGCLTTLASGRKVLLADIARYLGKPAMIVVVQSSAAVGFLDVSVVGLTCSASATHVIFHTKIPAS